MPHWLSLHSLALLVACPVILALVGPTRSDGRPATAIPRRRLYLHRSWRARDVDVEAERQLQEEIKRLRPASTAPYYWHGKFSNSTAWQVRQDYYLHGQYFNNSTSIGYPLSDSALAQMSPIGNYSWLLPLMRRLDAGGKATIMVLGGSMTNGERCQQPHGSHGEEYSWKECAWSARFANWLQGRFPQGTVDLQNKAINGALADVHLQLLGLTLKSLNKDVDLVLLDTSANGGTEKAYEQLIRSVHQLVPKAVVVGVVAAPHSKRTTGTIKMELRTLEHYGLPALDFSNFLLERPELWMVPPNAANWLHPLWQTHQIIADIMSNLWGRTWDSRASVGGSSEVWATELPSVFVKGADKVDFCLEPLSHHSAKAPIGEGLPGAARSLAGWRNYEDRPGKPGWIVTADHDDQSQAPPTIKFPLKFGAMPSVVVIYLRSYEGLGDATLKIAGNNKSAWLKGNNVGRRALLYEKLEGIWDKPNSQSEAFSTYLPSLLKNSEAELEVSLYGGPKFKVTDVMSC